MMVGFFPRDKLAVVKSFGIAEQIFNMRNDNLFTESINVGMIFLPDILYNTV